MGTAPASSPAASRSPSPAATPGISAARRTGRTICAARCARWPSSGPTTSRSWRPAAARSTPCPGCPPTAARSWRRWRRGASARGAPSRRIASAPRRSTGWSTPGSTASSMPAFWSTKPGQAGLRAGHGRAGGARRHPLHDHLGGRRLHAARAGGRSSSARRTSRPPSTAGEVMFDDNLSQVRQDAGSGRHLGRRHRRRLALYRDRGHAARTRADAPGRHAGAGGDPAGTGIGRRRCSGIAGTVGTLRPGMIADVIAVGGRPARRSFPPGRRAPGRCRAARSGCIGPDEPARGRGACKPIFAPGPARSAPSTG